MQKDILTIYGLNYHFCTISTTSHLFKCFALADSIAFYQGSLHILLVDEDAMPKSLPSNVQIHRLNEIQEAIGNEIIAKYSKNKDCLRWSLKPIFLIQMLKTFEQVIYIDNDILFFSTPAFLFDELQNNRVILTPHNYPTNPDNNQNWLEANFRVGLYNAGFLGVSKGANKVLNWWAKACLYRCEKNPWRGLFDDQKYLDLFPIIEAQSKVIHHLGCNAAEWNRWLHQIKLKDGKYICGDGNPLVFYHFNHFSLRELGKQSTLFQDYLKALQKYSPELNASDLIQKDSWLNKVKLAIWHILNRMNN